MAKRPTKMRSELPPGLMLVRKDDDGTSHWRVACDCGANEHDAELWIDAERGWPCLELRISTEIGVYPAWRDGFGAWFEDKIERVKHAAKVLWSGYATMRGEVILNEDGIKALQLALEEGVAHFKDPESRKVAEKWYGKEGTAA